MPLVGHCPFQGGSGWGASRIRQEQMQLFLSAEPSFAFAYVGIRNVDVVTFLNGWLLAEGLRLLCFVFLSSCRKCVRQT